MINYKELASLIDAGKDEEIMKALQDLPEQAVITLMDMQDAPHKQYLVNLLEPFVPSADALLSAQKGDTSNWDDEIIDYAFRTYANGDMPKEADFDYDQAKYEQAFDKFMSDGSAFQNYVAGLRKKYGESISGSNEDESDMSRLLKNVTDANHLPIEDGDEVFEDGGVSITDPRFDATSRWWFETPEDAIAYHGDKYADAIKQFYAKHPWETKDVNDDGDIDVVAADTNGDGDIDSVISSGDDDQEDADAADEAKAQIGKDKEDTTSTGKKKKELDTPDDSTLSDARFKNICLALLDNRF